MKNVRKNFINRIFPVMMQSMSEKNWITPEIELLGDAQELIKNVDVDGAGDSVFPNNLASS
jgi:hypothetical protein